MTAGSAEIGAATESPGGTTVGFSIVTAIYNVARYLPEFQERINRTFPRRDGRCCERAVRAIEAL